MPVTGLRLDRRGEANTRKREQRDTKSHDFPGVGACKATRAGIHGINIGTMIPLRITNRAKKGVFGAHQLTKLMLSDHWIASKHLADYMNATYRGPFGPR